MPPSAAPAAHVLLVHGAWHGPWVWDAVLGALAARGVSASTVALPTCAAEPAGLTLLDDARVVEEAVARIAGPVVVCAHSYGGMVITAAAPAPHVKELVYLCAFMPNEDAPLVSHFATIPTYAQVRPHEGVVLFATEMAKEVFYNDVDDAAARAATARLVPHAAGAVLTPPGRAAWKERPSTYVVCTKDNTIPPELQRRFAKQATRTVEIDTSHSPMLSAPDRLAVLLHEVATRAV